jgi:hypothetical protein
MFATFRHQALSRNFTVAGRLPPAVQTTVASSGRILGRQTPWSARQAIDTFSPPMSLLVECAGASSRCSLRRTGETEMAKKTATARKVKDLKVQKKSAVKVKGGIARNNKRTD